MRDQVELLRETELREPAIVEPVELPLPVAPDWDRQVQESAHMVKLIDRHLDYEERGRRMMPNERLMPIGLCPEQRLKIGIFPDGIARLPGRPEGNDSGMFQRNGLDHPEELDVLRVRAGPATLDKMDSEFIQFLRDADLILCREADIFGLRAVAQRRVVHLQRGRLLGWRPQLRKGTLSASKTVRTG